MHRFNILMAAQFLLLATLAGCSKKNAPPPPMPTVKVVTLKAQAAVLMTELPGRTTAFLTAEVRPQVNGIIQRRIFVEGAEVKANQQLYQIDPAVYKAALDTAEASLQRDQAALVTARAKADRYKPLAEAQAVSRQDYDDAVATSGEAAADIATAKAAIEQAQINLRYTKVAAPISGRISRSAVTPGALVTADQATALATVTQLDPIYVDVAQPATTLLRLERELASGKLQRSGAGQAVARLVLEDGTLYALPGTLQFSEVNVDQTTGTVVLRAVFPNPNHQLLPGLYVRAQLQEGTDEKALLVPQQAVSHNTHGDPTVLVVGEDRKVSLKIITTGRAIDNQWQVTSGLAAGEKVIVEGLQNAKPGIEVNATEAAPPAAPAQR
jgi:membrane fusion protein (multidrug efflux system)